MAGFHTKTFLKHDDYMTPKYAWENIKEYIPRDKVIWEAFYGDGKSGKYLEELGFNVIHEQIDFFEEDKGDIIVSNPPFSLISYNYITLQHLFYDLELMVINCLIFNPQDTPYYFHAKEVGAIIHNFMGNSSRLNFEEEASKCNCYQYFQTYTELNPHRNRTFGLPKF